jgi:hypothetical protein
VPEANVVALAWAVANWFLEADVLTTPEEVERAEGSPRIWLVQDKRAGQSAMNWQD